MLFLHSHRELAGTETRYWRLQATQAPDWALIWLEMIARAPLCCLFAWRLESTRQTSWCRWRPSDRHKKRTTSRSSARLRRRRKLKLKGKTATDRRGMRVNRQLLATLLCFVSLTRVAPLQITPKTTTGEIDGPHHMATGHEHAKQPEDVRRQR